MESMRSSGDEQQLAHDSMVRLRSKLKIQRQLLEYLIGYFERGAGGQTEKEKADLFSERGSNSAIFLIDSISERFAVWFESLCGTGDVFDDEENGSDFMSLEEFEAEFSGAPRRVLEAVLAQSFVGDHEDIDEYLQELLEWSKVKPPSDPFGEQTLQRLVVPIQAHVTTKSVHGVLDAMDGSGAESAS